MNLRTPGPTPIPDDIMETMMSPMVDHRGPEFAKMLPRITDNLKTLFLTDNDVLVLTASGSGGLEAAIVNVLSPGEKILAVSIGSFGDRFGKIAEIYGAEVIWLRKDWGLPVLANEVASYIDRDPEITSVLITHNETSTGVTNPLQEIAKEVKSRDKLLIVDAVSSLGSLPCAIDDWDLDVVVTGSQKGWMVPPGLAMVSMSDRAWQANSTAKMPRAYFDLAAAREYAKRGQTPWTPALSLFNALNKSLELMIDEGLENIHARHKRVADKVRAEVRSAGLSLFPKDELYCSNTVTAVNAGDGMDIAEFRSQARSEGVVFAGGQGKLSGSIFRIGHLGYIPDAEIDEALQVLRKILK
ncbi:MAG: pyridoxal-phosphate-dependent aminotransferase family protein [Dehalococcoidia bacterium]